MNLLFPKEKITFDIPDAEIEYYPNFFDSSLADELFEKLRSEIPWQQDTISVFGKTHLQPRLTSLFGNEGKPYSYSNIVMQPHTWSALVLFIRNEIEKVCHEKFTTVLLNYYRDGKDSNGWHADNEKELGQNPVIASVSFGAVRPFHLKHNSIKEQRLKINLEPRKFTDYERNNAAFLETSDSENRKGYSSQNKSNFSDYQIIVLLYLE